MNIFSFYRVLACLNYVHFSARAQFLSLALGLNGDLDPVQTWCSCPVPEHGHQSEQSLLLMPEHKFGHHARARALAREVVLGHCAQARALI